MHVELFSLTTWVFMPSSKKKKTLKRNFFIYDFQPLFEMGTWHGMASCTCRQHSWQRSLTCTHPHANKCCRWQPMYSCHKQEVWLCSLLHYKHYAECAFVLLHWGPKNGTKEKMGALELPTAVFRQAAAYHSMQPNAKKTYWNTFPNHICSFSKQGAAASNDVSSKQ